MSVDQEFSTESHVTVDGSVTLVIQRVLEPKGEPHKVNVMVLKDTTVVHTMFVRADQIATEVHDINGA